MASPPPLPAWLPLLLVATFVLGFLVCRRRGLPPPPPRLPLLALLVWGVSLLIPGGLPWLGGPWITILVSLLLVLAGVRLLLWLLLELPGALGWWRRPPELLVQLLLVSSGGLAAVLLMRQVARYDLVGLVTTSAVLTAVIGLAAQEPLKDLIAGLELQLGDDIRLGDLVEVGQARGVVDSVSWRDTTLRTFDGVLVVLPNTQVTGGVLRNLSVSGAVSDRFEVGLDYDFPPARASALLLRVARQHPLVLEEPPPEVRLRAFADSAITYEVMVWFRTPSDGVRYTLRSELLQQIWYALQREGRSIPFPVRELQRRQVTPASALVSALTPEQGRRLLASHSLFADLPATDLDCLLAHSRPVLFAAGEAIVEEGASGESLYQVIEGRVSVEKRTAAGVTVQVTELGVGEIFGEMTLFQGAPRSATVRALVESRVLRVDRAGVRQLLAVDPDLLDRFAALVSARRRELDSLDLEERERQATTLIETMRRLFFAFGSG